jgi:hypothetical protein
MTLSFEPQSVFLGGTCRESASSRGQSEWRLGSQVSEGYPCGGYSVYHFFLTLQLPMKPAGYTDLKPATIPI